jgi:hypothetical protein
MYMASFRSVYLAGKELLPLIKGKLGLRLSEARLLKKNILPNSKKVIG